VSELLAAGGSHDLYDALIVAHVVCAVVGFGSLAITGVYGFTTRRPGGPPRPPRARRYFRSPGHLELLVLPVPVLGIAALAVEPGGRGVGQLWAGLGIVVWAVAAVVLVRVVRPAEAALRSVLAVPDPDAGALAGSGRRLGWGGIVMDLSFFVALMLMVFQPR
jgi:uncharacterized membrane protein